MATLSPPSSRGGREKAERRSRNTAGSPPLHKRHDAVASGDLRFASKTGDDKQRGLCGSSRSASHAERDAAVVGRGQIAIARHRPEREELPVAVIAQIEHARETGRGEALFVPQSFAGLMVAADSECRAGPADGRPRLPPSGRAEPRRSATPCSAPAHSRDNRACSSRRPRPSRHRHSGFAAASRRHGAPCRTCHRDPAALSAQSDDHVP